MLKPSHQPIDMGMKDQALMSSLTLIDTVTVEADERHKNPTENETTSLQPTNYTCYKLKISIHLRLYYVYYDRSSIAVKR